MILSVLSLILEVQAKQKGKIMTDNYTTNVTAAAYVAGMNADEVEPDFDEFGTDTRYMTRCPRRCGAKFHGKSPAYFRHVALTVCPDVWA